MGKAEDIFNARQARQAAEAAKSFNREAAPLFAEIDRLLSGFASLAERAGYPDMQRLYNPRLSDNVVGWRLQKSYGYGDSGPESFVTASDGALLLGSNRGLPQLYLPHTSWADYGQSIKELRETVSLLRDLRNKLEDRVPNPIPAQKAVPRPNLSPVRKSAPQPASSSFFGLFRSKPTGQRPKKRKR